MNAQKFTQKSLEAIQSAQNVAVEKGNAQIEQEHLLYALLTQDDGLIPQLLKKMGVDENAFRTELRSLIDRMPAVSGSGHEAGKIYVSADVDATLTEAEKQAGHMKDEYVSVEHLMLALFFQGKCQCKRAFAPLPR